MKSAFPRYSRLTRQPRFQEGDRVKLKKPVNTRYDHTPIPPGTRGTITRVRPAHCIKGVKYDILFDGYGAATHIKHFYLHAEERKR